MSNEAKKPRMSSEIPIPIPGTCSHWVRRKKRFCKMTVVTKGGAHDYCGEHKPPTATATGDETKNDDRIPCPLDGKHTVYRNKLAKHLAICNAKPKEKEEPYIVKDINAGDVETDDAAEDFATLRLSELSDEEFYGVIMRVRELHREFVEGRIEVLDVKHKSMDAVLAKEEYGKETRKHLLQASALLGILETEGQMQNDTCFIEFGAGKGQLAYFLAQELHQREDSQVVLVDRMSLRHKKDNKIEVKSLVHRIRADIADFCMTRFDLFKTAKNAVAVSKHLCGAATDLTLRCITQAATKSDPPFHTDFVLIALCCHHRCDWRSFVGKEFFRAHSLSPRQFVIMTKMVSWAICGTGQSRERRQLAAEQSKPPSDVDSNDPTKRVNLADREEIGFMCKRVLDHARLDYLRQHGYEAALKNYVPRDVTLENVCLVAKKAK